MSHSLAALPLQLSPVPAYCVLLSPCLLCPVVEPPAVSCHCQSHCPPSHVQTAVEHHCLKLPPHNQVVVWMYFT